MLIVVDDEETVRDTIAEVLREAGFEVLTFSGAVDALEAAEARSPEAVIADLMMPVMSGLIFQREYRSRFPKRETPFVFMSSLDEDQSIIAALEGGAEDYLIKPLSPAVLIAKIRTILQRTKKRTAANFEGDLSKLSFNEILKFCELKGLTGTVKIESGEKAVRLDFIAGSIQVDDENMDDIDSLFEATNGRFAIYSKVVDFTEIHDATIAGNNEESADYSAENAPPGLLSAVRIGGRLFQIQTEILYQPEPIIISIATVDGELVTKRKTTVESHNPDESKRLISSQHAELENEIQNGEARVPEIRQSTEHTKRELYHQSLDRGFECFRKGDYEGAMEAWNAALALDPESKTLKVNMAVLKSKLESNK